MAEIWQVWVENAVTYVVVCVEFCFSGNTRLGVVVHVLFCISLVSGFLPVFTA